MTDRAVSETVGFVLVFAIVVSTIGMVYSNGFVGLQEVRDVERTNNAQRAFEVLADNMEDVTKRGAPSRATEIKLADADLYIDEPVTVNVSVPGDGFHTAYEVRPIVYDAESDERIVYSQGAIIRERENGGGLVVHESTLVMNGSRTVIPVVQTRRGGVGSVGGGGTVLVRARHSKTAVVYTNTTATNAVWLNVTSPRAGAWKSYLEDDPDVTCEPVSGETASCRVTADSLYVTVVKVDVALE